MNRFALIALAVQANLFVIAQNLVPNPSFEEYVDCPQSTGELHTQVVDWVSWQFSPDFFHVCNNDGLGTAGVPQNAWGFQEPITGDAYSAVSTHSYYKNDVREYLAALLLSPLVEGQEYYVRFYTSRCDSGAASSDRLCKTNNIGLRFFKDPSFSIFPPVSNPFEPDNFAHINSDQAIEDDQNWTLIDGWFTADEAYDWVAIGNFFDDSQTVIEYLNGSTECFGLYYIENVCIAQSPEECEYLMNIEQESETILVGAYPNPSFGSVTLSLPKNSRFEAEVFNTAGQIVHSCQEIVSGHRLDLNHLNKGVYVLRVSNASSLQTIKLVLR